MQSWDFFANGNEIVASKREAENVREKGNSFGKTVNSATLGGVRRIPLCIKSSFRIASYGAEFADCVIILAARERERGEARVPRSINRRINLRNGSIYQQTDGSIGVTLSRQRQLLVPQLSA